MVWLRLLFCAVSSSIAKEQKKHELSIFYSCHNKLLREVLLSLLMLFVAAAQMSGLPDSLTRPVSELGAHWQEERLVLSGGRTWLGFPFSHNLWGQNLLVQPGCWRGPVWQPQASTFRVGAVVQLKWITWCSPITSTSSELQPRQPPSPSPGCLHTHFHLMGAFSFLLGWVTMATLLRNH